jgi:Xaa-Pro aminopeptidase
VVTSPVAGDPIVVTPFFEAPTIREMLMIPAEVRTWQEDEEPLKLVADFLKERGVARQPVGFEETNRFWILDRLKHQLPGTAIVSANPVVRALRMIKSPTELALMQSAADITIAAYRAIYPQIGEGMNPAIIGQLFSDAIVGMGGSSPWALVLLGEAAAYPHGTGKPRDHFEAAALCRGPGNLTRALGISLQQNLRDLTASELRIEDPGLPARELAWSPRIGISVGVDTPRRCAVADHPAVSGRRAPLRRG